MAAVEDTPQAPATEPDPTEPSPSAKVTLSPSTDRP